MTTLDRQMTDQYLLFTEEERAAGRLDILTFCKVMMQIAAEYLIEHGDEQQCLVVMNKVPEVFFTHDLANTMNSDSLFRVQMVEFAHHLERCGITFEVMPTTTQGAAQA